MMTHYTFHISKSRFVLCVFKFQIHVLFWKIQFFVNTHKYFFPILVIDFVIQNPVFLK